MSKERTLANIAHTAFWNTMSENKDTFDRVAKAVEKEVLERLNKSEFEPVAGQELTFVQAAQWVEKHGSTKGLQWLDGNGKWRDEDVEVVYALVDYRVAPKKVNDPDDPATWEKGVVVLAGGGGFLKLGKFLSCNRCMDYPYLVDFEDYTDEVENAKLATPEQIKAWKLINDDAEGAI